MANKFTAKDVAKYKEWKKQFDANLKIFKTYALYKSPTATSFNKAKLSQIWELYEAGVQLGDLFRDLSNIAYKDYNFAKDGTQTDKYGFKISSKQLTERQPGWHKDHYNFNKAEKWELPPSLRRTPARNVTKTGAKRKRATKITKYKR